MRQAIEYRPGDLQQRQRFKEEIEAYIAGAYDQIQKEQMKDVYVTDHEPKPRKYHTSNKKEDEDFYRYQKSLEEYNSTAS